MRGRTMKTRYLLTALCSFALASVSALAGTVLPAPVIIDLDNKIAQGDMLTARDSADATAFIGCGVRYFDDGAGLTFEYGFCQAAVAGESVVCLVQSPGLLQAVHSLGDYSYIQFSWDDEFNCTRVGSSTQSFYLPKTKSNE